MKNALLIFSFLFVCNTYAQDLFIKSYPTSSTVFIQNQNIKIQALDNGNFVVAGTHDSPNTIGTLFIRMFNACGTELWHKEISDIAISMDLMNLNLDSLNHILVAGNLGQYDTLRTPYILKFDFKGNLIYAKLLSSFQGYNSLLYSGSVAPNGDYLVYGLHHYRTSPPDYAKILITRISPNGTLKWAKNYDFGFRSWGRMIATKDNGALAKTSNTIFKVDSLGAIEWAKSFYPLGSLRPPIETDSGYVFPRYYIGGIDRGSVFNLNFKGELTWNTQSFFNFFPYDGIKKRNGNLLFPATNPLNGNTAVFVELDFKNGNILKHKELQNTAINGIFANNISETTDGDILFAGPDNRGIVQQLAIGKLNDTLTTITCNSVDLLPPNEPYNIRPIKDDTATIVNNTDLLLANHPFIITSPVVQSGFEDCAYTKPRGTLDLGSDTNLCIGQSVILGNNMTSFDSYLWSNGSTNKSIGVNQSGSYWLQVISACDTLRDTIQVNYIPGILFSLGPDTTSCADSIVLGLHLNPSNNYVWSTGETSTSITVKTSGTYWVEHNTKCNSYRDSINVIFRNPLPSINLGRDTILCPKQSIQLGNINSQYNSFLWSDNSNNKTLIVSSAGNYWLRATESCGNSSDTIQVNYYPNIGLDLGKDTNICSGDILVLGISRSLNNYSWSTGATTPSIVVSVAGTYWLETQTNCGPVRDSINVGIIPNINQPFLGIDTTICSGQTIELSSNSNAEYRWSTGENISNITASEGIYWIDNLNRCDTLRDSIKITYFNTPKPLIQVSKVLVKSKDSIVFINAGPKNNQPIWDFGDGNIANSDSTVHTFEKAGTYRVILTTTSINNCLEKTSLVITVEPSEYFIPNAFSPNNDNTNDIFFPIGDDIVNYDLKIYNRWGNQIYKSHNIPWDGRSSNGRKLEAGVYSYVIKINLSNGLSEEFKGNVTLFR
jgi:gliding motility-associated-like protein